MPDKKARFIEESFPVKEVGAAAAREKNIRHGHICTLHIWWARRPLASSRATNFAALIPATADIVEWNKTRQFIVEFAKWENSLDKNMIARARREILAANAGEPPRVLDPFAGGGAIPLEALRLGCETYSGDLNPVAVLIQKCTLEYPQKYGQEPRFLRRKRGSEDGVSEDEGILLGGRPCNPLLEDVKKWGAWVLAEAKREIGRFYPAEPDGSIPVGYIWARTIPCQNPACGAEIPLMRQFWLAKKVKTKKKKRVALYPEPRFLRENGVLREVQFRIVGDGYEEMPADFDPSNGTVARAIATCPICGAVVAAKDTHRLFQEGKAGQRMVAVVEIPQNPVFSKKTGFSGGKRYRVATAEDMQVFRAAAAYLREKRAKLTLEWGMDPVPDELLPPIGTLGFRIQRYGMNTWGDLFNSRQKLALITFAEKVRGAYEQILAEVEPRFSRKKRGSGQELEPRFLRENGVLEAQKYARAVVSYLALEVNMAAAFSNTLARWENTSEAIKQLYGRQALPMLWDHAEVNPFSGSSGSWETGCKYYLKVTEHCSQIQATPATVIQSSATSLPHADNFFDAVLTDPPYYDNVPYSYLSDFFYVWLKRTIGNLYPELFSTPLTPKRNEIVAYSHGPGGFEEGKKFFEDMLKKSFQEIHRVLKPNGIAVIVYAHKSTEGWETLVNSLLDSGLIMTGAWPLRTEMAGRLRARESAALASSIYIVARKMARLPTGFYNEVKEELKRYLNQKLQRLWEEGIGGADFFIAAIGSAIEVFGKYEKVMDYGGNIIRADRMLDDIRLMTTDYAVRQILHDGFSGEISDLTRFYVLYRWNYGAARVHFDEARKLAQSCGLDLAQEWGKRGFVVKSKEFISALGPHQREPRFLGENGVLEQTTELIDVLHWVLLLWEKGQQAELIRVLQVTGYGDHEAFYRVAQAVSETLPIQNKEKKLLDGFLAGRERVQEAVRRRAVQDSLL